MLDVAVERRSMQERESVFAAALQNAQDAIGQAKTQENKAAAVDKDHNFISAKLPTTARNCVKLQRQKILKLRSAVIRQRTQSNVGPDAGADCGSAGAESTD